MNSPPLSFRVSLWSCSLLSAAQSDVEFSRRRRRPSFLVLVIRACWVTLAVLTEHSSCPAGDGELDRALECFPFCGRLNPDAAAGAADDGGGRYANFSIASPWLSNDELTEPVSLLLLLLLLRHAATLRHADSLQQSQSITSIAFLLPFFSARCFIGVMLAAMLHQRATRQRRQANVSQSKKNNVVLSWLRPTTNEWLWQAWAQLGEHSQWNTSVRSAPLRTTRAARRRLTTLNAWLVAAVRPSVMSACVQLCYLRQRSRYWLPRLPFVRASAK